MASTDNEIMIKGVYQKELPVVYNPPKPKKIIPTDEDLGNADLFSFGSKIGQITNKSTIAYSILPQLIEQYGEDSKEVQLTISRLQQCCKAQSAQIDKAKIGREVKAIPKVWVEYQKTKEGEIDPEKELMNSIILNKHPYFFRYLYKDTNSSYNSYVRETNIILNDKGINDIEELRNKPNPTEKDLKLLQYCEDKVPVLLSECVMNQLCFYIENVNKDIKQKIRFPNEENMHEIYRDPEVEYTRKQYNDIIKKFKLHIKSRRVNASVIFVEKNNINTATPTKNVLEFLSDSKYNSKIVLNCLIDYCYKENIDTHKEIMWSLMGKGIYENLKRKNNGTIKFPIQDENGELRYLNKNYSLKEIQI